MEFVAKKSAIFLRDEDMGERIKKQMHGETLRMRSVVESQAKIVRQMQESLEKQQQQNDEIKQMLMALDHRRL